ncbi:PspC domain-containing protein [Kineosporia mesophila]|nr:PspC domain-containing protein [Kineosporia mesophila]MCD5349920.1 PspC domain-containing protein [Kineosporia mesophila]
MPETQEPSAPPSTPPARPGDEFFAKIREQGVFRPAENRWVAGVGSGLSRRLDIDQTLIRGTFVALSIIGGLGVALYGVCWLLLPQEQDGRIHVQEAMRGRFSPGFFAGVILALAAVGGGGPWRGNGHWFWGFPGTLILAALIVGGLWWMAKRLPQNRDQVPPAAMTTDFSQKERTAHEEAARQHHEAQQLARARTAPSRRVRQLTLGLALIAATGVLMAEAFGDLPGWAGLTALGVAIAVIAGGVVANGLMGRRSPGLAGLGVLLSLILAVGAAAQHAGVETSEHMAAVGTATWAPDTREAADDQYNLGIGEAELNLTSAGALSGATTSDPLEVEANLGVGHLVLNLPSGVAVQVDARLGAGEVYEPDGTRYEVKGNSDNRSRTFTYGEGEPVLKVVAQQGVGQMEINRVPQTTGSN